MPGNDNRPVASQLQSVSLRDDAPVPVSPLIAELFRHVPVPILLADEEDFVAFANPLAESLLGLERAFIEGRALSELLPETGASGACPVDRLLAGGRGSAELTGRNADGRMLHLRVSLDQCELGDRRLTICSLIDSSERSWLLEQNRLIYSRLNESQRIARIGSWDLNVCTGTDWWSEELIRMLEVDLESGLTLTEQFENRVHPDDRIKLKEGSSRALAGERTGSVNVRVQIPGGGELICQTQGDVVQDEDGNIVRMHGTLQDVTDQVKAEAERELLELRYREAQQIANVGSWEWDLVTNESWWSDELYTIIEETPESYPATFDNWISKVHPEDRAGIQDAHDGYSGGELRDAPQEVRLVMAGGREKFAEVVVRPRLGEDGKPVAIIGVVHDVSERRALETRLHDAESSYENTVELAPVGIVHVHPSGRFIWSNRRFNEMLGYSLGEIKQLTLWDVSHPEDRGNTDRQREAMYSGKVQKIEVEKRYLRKNGTPIWVRIATTVRRDIDGKALYDIAIVEDITERRQAAERIEFLATHDELTGLPNRLLFTQLLDQAVVKSRAENRSCAVLFVDIDRFKTINDSLGHDAGDNLLKEMASRLQRAVREEDIVARLGGDEFVVLLPWMKNQLTAAAIARQALSNVLAPVQIKGRECRVTASIGIAVCPQDGSDGTLLLKHADAAMYQAKDAGKNNFQFYSAGAGPMSIDRLILESHLARALERQEFTVQYQPKVDLRTGQVSGAEALIRWWNDELGTISPAQFVPLAEDSGLIVPIGLWVLRTACEQAIEWRNRGLPEIVMAVNLSPRQFKDENLLDDVARVIHETGMPPHLLELEITETMIMQNLDRVLEIMAGLKNLGLRLAIDDFGTGYSSLAQLKRFPIDTLKVDRSFIRDLPDNREDKAITQAITSLGKTLGVKLVAEGVEETPQRDFLRALGCDEMQGFLFSKPCHPDAFAAMLAGDCAEQGAQH